MLGKSVQFRGSETVLTAFLNRDCSAWSLWVGGQFLFKYAGENVEEARQALQDTLIMIEQSESTAIYTLKVYEELPKGVKIKEKTECDGSFNFRLQDDLPSVNRVNYQNSMSSQLAALNKKLDDYMADDAEEDESTMGQIGKFLEHPIAQRLVSGILGINIQPQTGAINGIPAANQDGKATKAIELLKTKDPRIGEHLEKLANIAEKQPQNFAYMLSLIEGLPT
jgi:hypothetical protein